MSQNNDVSFQIEQIHRSNLKLSLVLAGGGGRLIGDLTSVPGASRTLLDAQVPYSQQSLAELLGYTPQSFCHPAVATGLAVRSFHHALRRHEPQFESLSQELVSLACTASLATDRPRKGLHRFFVATQSRHQTRLTSVTLEKNLRTRPEEEALVADICRRELVSLIDPGTESCPGFPGSGDSVQAVAENACETWQRLFLGEELIGDGNGNIASPHPGDAVLSGSFDPVHPGHLEMAEWTRKHLGINVRFELCIRNADKPPLDYLTIRQRAEQFDTADLLLTNAGTFLQKSQLLPGSLFIVGVDTIRRIADPVYYGSEQRLDEAIELLNESDCRFLVFGRLDENGFQTLSSLNLPTKLVKLCDEVPESDFRLDISSTKIRQKIQSPWNSG